MSHIYMRLYAPTCAEALAAGWLARAAAVTRNVHARKCNRRARAARKALRDFDVSLAGGGAARARACNTCLIRARWGEPRV